MEATDDALVDLLRGLEASDWERTAVGSWSVRDVAAHLLDGNLRRLSFLRDGATPPPPQEPIRDYPSLLAFLNQLNAEWIRAARRLSGRVITDWLAASSPQVRAYLSSLDPNGTAPFAVDWAGQDQTTTWLDIAREYTEKWHHQQQIRGATGRPGLTERRFVEPLLEILLRAVPKAYEQAPPSGRDSLAVAIRITDYAGCVFLLGGKRGAFQMFRASEDGGSKPDAVIRLSSDTAWRFLMKGLGIETARARAEIDGEAELTEPFFSSRAVMA